MLSGTVGSCCTDDSINACLVPAIEIAVLESCSLELKLPPLGGTQISCDSIGFHLRSPRLICTLKFLSDSLSTISCEHALKKFTAFLLVNRIPFDDGMSRRFKLLLGDQESSSYRWCWPDHAVVPHECDL